MNTYHPNIDGPAEPAGLSIDASGNPLPKWRSCRYDPPIDGEVVMTKIDDLNGARNEQQLKRQGRLWFFPEGSMYVYYVPTHWHTI